MEYKIGETFDLDGIKLKVKKANDKSNHRCKGCYLNNLYFDCLNHTAGSCSSLFRTDKTNVIFKKVK